MLADHKQANVSAPRVAYPTEFQRELQVIVFSQPQATRNGIAKQLNLTPKQCCYQLRRALRQGFISQAFFDTIANNSEIENAENPRNRSGGYKPRTVPTEFQAKVIQLSAIPTITKEDLAKMVCSTAKSINYHLDAIRAKGWISAETIERISTNSKKTPLVKNMGMRGDLRAERVRFWADKIVKLLQQDEHAVHRFYAFMRGVRI